MFLAEINSTQKMPFYLSPNKFMDGFSVKHPADICSCCDDCGADFTLQHGMDYKKGP